MWQHLLDLLTATRRPLVFVDFETAGLNGAMPVEFAIAYWTPWADAEMLVTGITEGTKNSNAAKTNSLGRTERSSAAAGLIPNGQVGSIQGTLLKDFIDPISGKKLFSKGLPITVGSGEMSVAQATHYFEHPEEIVGHIVKFKHMTHGVKDVPRFGTYVSHRLAEDMSE